MIAHMADKGARVDALNCDDAVVLQKLRKRHFAAPVAGLLAQIAHHQAAAGRFLALAIFKINAVIADLRIGHRDDLACI